MRLISVIEDPVIAKRSWSISVSPPEPPRRKPRRLGQLQLALDDVPDPPDYDAVDPIFAEA